MVPQARKGRVTVIPSRSEGKRVETVTETQGRESYRNVPLRFTRSDTSILRQPCGEGAIGICPDLPFFPFSISCQLLPPPLKSNWKAEGMRASCRPDEASFWIEQSGGAGRENVWERVCVGRQETLSKYR